MDHLVVNNYIALLDRLDLESRLTILSALADSIKRSVEIKETTDKSKLLYELYGSWANVDDSIIDDIYQNRSMPGREISFD